MNLSKWMPALLAGTVAIALPIIAQVRPTAAARRPKLAEMSQAQINYIRPGVKVKVVSAGIAKDGTITARVKVTDPKDVPLDMNGVTTPGPITLRFIAAYIPAGQKEYVSYTTTVLKATLNNNPSQTQAATDSGGTFTTNADGDYTYTFKTKAPTNFEAGSTHTIGVSAQRNLSEFMTYDEWSQTANDTFNFVPDGSAVKVTRNVVPTSACNQCHDPLFGHGGSRLTVEMCILCHTPQTVNPDTNLTQDMPVLIHKIHMGKNLPSVQAGTPYRIWHRSAWSDFSDVGFPSGTDELMTCTVCHQNAAQAANYMTAPSRAACGACHYNVNFATGQNHVNLPQVSDNNCTTCHIPQGDMEFDASIKGAHTVQTRSVQLPGVNFEITRVDNAKPGAKVTVTFAVRDRTGALMDVSKIDRLNLILAGPTTDYSLNVSEDARKATVSAGLYTYTFAGALPNNAKGSYAIGIEGYKNMTINPGTVKAATVRDAGMNKVFYFSVDGSKVAPRRQIVSQDKCQTCHNTLYFHGGNRQSVEFCAVCHNPAATDSAQRAAGATPESINFKSMIHKIHTGSELTNDFTVMGHNQSVNNYNEVGYVGDRRDCGACHVNNSFNLPLPDTAVAQAAPRDYITQQQPITAACLSCHTTKAAAAHADANTSATLGESCAACHGPNSDASVANVHKR